jgi:diguanylate cyclase
MSAGMSAWMAQNGWAVIAFAGLCLATAVIAVAWARLALRRQAAVLPAPPARTAGPRDGLTGLIGRHEFEAAIDAAVRLADAGGLRFALLYADIDDLHSVNEAYGHEIGDALLRDVAARLARLTGPHGVVVSRIAADEFAFIVPGDRETGLRSAETLRALIAEPFDAHGRELRMACSVGVAAYPHHGSRATVLANALLAMRAVKQAGGGAHAEYDSRMGEVQRSQVELLHDLRVALQRGQFELYYQPKIDAHSLQVTAAEALLRWHHPARGLVSPAVFIPIAERHGLIGEIGQWVIAEACRQAAAWRDIGLRMRVAVNISGYQLRQEDLVPRIEAALESNRIPPARFTCEITESVAMEDTRVTQQAFERLRRAGVHVSIDDFGTGHSSLAALSRLPAAELKIDRAFVNDLAGRADARTIVRAIVQMAHTLALRVVAEGVETEAQRDLLVEMGCDELQGFLFAKPMTAQALSLWASMERDDEAERHSGFRRSLFAETLPADLGPR